MSRARNIKPSFFTNDLLAECEPLARLLFAGLWTIADREGRLEDRPKKIKAELLPYDNCEPESLLSQLEKHGFITRYVVGEFKYIQILNFVKHQNPHVKEASSTIPAPDKTGAGPVQNVPLTDSPIPLPLSPILIPESPKPSPGKKSDPPDSDFEDFYHVFPLHKGKEDARKSYIKARKSGATHDEIISGAGAYAALVASEATEPRFIAHPSTWLNGKRWNDDHATARTTERKTGNSRTDKPTFTDEAKRIAAEFLAQPGGQSQAESRAGPDMRTPEAIREDYGEPANAGAGVFVGTG